jgi:hypothetical protein
MSKIRLLIIAIAIICVVALGAFALVASPVQDPADDIIIKGGSLEIQCKGGTDCLGPSDGHGRYKHKKSNNHILKVEVRDSTGSLYSKAFDKAHQPEIEITFR